STRRRSSPKSGGGGGESSLGAGEIPNFGEVVRGGHPQDGTGHGPALFRSACEMTTEIDPQIGMEQVKALVDLGRFDRALPLAQRLVATDPDDARAHELVGRCLLGLGRPWDAVIPADAVRALEPAAAWAQRFAAFAHLRNV